MANQILSKDINFIPGQQLEVYFPIEQIEYRLVISENNLGLDSSYIVADLPNDVHKGFYKGEDFIECRYVHDNVVYEFGGDVVRILHEGSKKVVIKKPMNFKASNTRSKERVSTQIACEYVVEKVIPGARCSRTMGFITIKDASIGGVSFVTNDSFPMDTVLKIQLIKTDIVLKVEVKKHQIVNDKNFYGGRIVEFDGESEKKYHTYIQKELMKEKEEIDSYIVY